MVGYTGLKLINMSGNGLKPPLPVARSGSDNPLNSMNI